jgi:hypothetical protein
MADKKLLIDYDEDKQQVFLYELRDGAAPVFEVKVPVSLFQEQDAQSAERMMGAAVFAFLDRRATHKIGVRPYEAESQDALRQMRDHLKEGAQSGDPEAQFHLALDRFADAVRNRSIAQLDEADSLIRSAARGGHQEARQYLESHWPREKAAALRTIKG